MSFVLCRGNRLWFICLTLILSIHSLKASENRNDVEILELDIIQYEDFKNNTPEASAILYKALYDKGIVGIRGVPGYRESYFRFIEAAKTFTSQPEEIKELCAPRRDLGETFLGYESGKEKFQLPDGRWIIDDLKVSYYAHNPDGPENRWPLDGDFQEAYAELTSVMSAVGIDAMERIGLIGPGTGIAYENAPRVCRMLYYKKSIDGGAENPFWCGAHFDHCMLTAILPAVYFKNGQQIQEPIEAGLFIRTDKGQPYRKIIADDYDVMMFQVGEFGQLATNDKIRATEHRVHKAAGGVERYTMAAFFNAPMDAVIRSTSTLTADERYGASPGEPCSFEQWHIATFNRYLVKDEN